jgi:cytoskeletal protein CcmA (bactofilin family)
LSYFSQSKGERDKKDFNGSGPEIRLEAPGSGKVMPEVVSILGPGMLITGNIICAGSVQIFGRVIGDIHATRLLICAGAEVEGNVTVQEMVIDGAFKGAIHGNSVKLQGTASVEGEIFNKSLTIEQNALFEGVARRLDIPVDAPSDVRAKGKMPTLVPIEPAAPAHQTAG